MRQRKQNALTEELRGMTRRTQPRALRDTVTPTHFRFGAAASGSAARHTAEQPRAHLPFIQVEQQNTWLRHGALCLVADLLRAFATARAFSNAVILAAFSCSDCFDSCLPTTNHMPRDLDVATSSVST